MDVEIALAQRAHVEEFQRKHRIALLTLLFTDTVDSTAIKQALGDRKALALIQRHDAVVREILASFADAEEIETAGDSFFIVFAKPSDSVRFALLLQARLRTFVEESPQPVLDRIGIHVGEVFVAETQDASEPKDLYGLQINICARIMSLAAGDQILLSRFVFDSARQVLSGEDIPDLGPISWLNHGPYLLKGFDELIEVCEVGETGKALLSLPADSAKAHRYISPDAEPMLGWRPAVQQGVPGTDWSLERKLGEGGFGEIWLGRNRKSQALRVFKFCFRADRVRALKREDTLFRLLKGRIGKHPNIVGIEEIYFDQPPFYIAMGFGGERDLIEWCRAKGDALNIPLTTRLEIVAQIADALHAAHGAGIIHRDVKPSNILIGDDSSEGSAHAKLTDFGIGQVVANETLAGIQGLGFTQTMFSPDAAMQSGTFMYMAPELIAGKLATPQTDIFSLGIVLYQLLVGDFSRPLPPDWLRQVADSPLRVELMRCFAAEQRSRFANAREFAESLRSLNVQRPRTLDWKRAAAFLYGAWGTGPLYVVGLSFIAAQYAALPMILAGSVLAVLCAFSFTVVCRCLPDGGGVYSAARRQSRLLATVGGITLIADFAIAASLSIWAALRNLPLGAGLVSWAAVPVLGMVYLLNVFGPRRSGTVQLFMVLPALAAITGLIALSVPHLTFDLNLLDTSFRSYSDQWTSFVGVILLVAGVEMISNLTGVMKRDSRTYPKTLITNFDVVRHDATLSQTLYPLGKIYCALSRYARSNLLLVTPERGFGIGSSSTAEAPKVNRVSTMAIWITATMVICTTVLLGWAMLSLPQTEAMSHALHGAHTYMPRFLGAQYGAVAFGETFGEVFGWFVGIVSALLLLGAANTAITATTDLLYAMAQDGEVPRSLIKLNRHGVPSLALIIAVALPASLLLLLAGIPSQKDVLRMLAPLYAIATVAALTLTFGVFTFSRRVAVKLGSRMVIAVSFLVLLAALLTLAFTKHDALFFYVVIILGIAFALRLVREKHLPTG